ncbi:MAG: DNA-directed RNA polymerase subunit beta' [Deltaproteobacteria bacterium]|nr:DNA-directed RNA polymerase subunit beta' [Deltaproteobacteria bacterium]
MEDIQSLFDRPNSSQSFDAVRISIASSEKIREWSYGEVKKPETINYRTFKPERDGLFCAKIFGPTLDYECNCGKYKRLKHKGVTCEKCGVEVTRSDVRRERLGHIELNAPVAHIWFLRNRPSIIGTLLDMTLRDLEKVLYFESYVVLHPGDTPLKEKELLSEEAYRKAVEEYGPNFKAEMGAEAIKELLKRLNLDSLYSEIRSELRLTTSKTKKEDLAKRLLMVDKFKASRQRPELMILDIIPVLPPDLRPLVPLDGGRFATSDLNDLYRRVINRNNRLARLMELNAPEIIIMNEKRMLQEAVDALFDNGSGGRVITGPDKKPLKSLSDMIKGKEGRFRQNLLGKRVDYSGRSVIVPDPTLKLHQCGLPRKMALELFKPFLYNKLEQRGIATTIKSAKMMVEKERPEVWDILEEVTREHPVLLNRAPTLHRLGIQAFEPVLHDDKAIRLHPLVCKAFNADFDGDQMAVHIPLSKKAQLESRMLMMTSENLLSPADGRPVVTPTKEMVLGLYYLTMERQDVGENGESGGDKPLPYDKEFKNTVERRGGPCGLQLEREEPKKLFASTYEVMAAFHAGFISEHTKVKVRIDGQIIETTAGRVLLKDILPEGIPFNTINKTLRQREIIELIEIGYAVICKDETAKFLDRLKDLGFEYATKSGISISINDLPVPVEKSGLVELAWDKVLEYRRQCMEGTITKEESYISSLDLWCNITEKIRNAALNEIQGNAYNDANSSIKPQSSNPIFMMIDSGARGNSQQIGQLSGMVGLRAKLSGELSDMPIASSYREGLRTHEYYMSSVGIRKGLADTALKIANAGYLTRRLVDVAQDTIIIEEDCRTTSGISVSALISEGRMLLPLKDRIVGRFAAEEARNPKTEEVIIFPGMEITEEIAKAIVESGINEVPIRTGLTCQSSHGICAKCYGWEPSTKGIVEVGEAVGIIAAQSIGEPATQCVLDSKKLSGEMVANISLARVAEIFEARVPKEKDVVNYHKCLHENGILASQQGMVNDLQAIYRKNNIAVHEKHFEVIVRKMTEKIRIEDPGDSMFLKGEVVRRKAFYEENAKVGYEGGSLAVGPPVILGVRKASLQSDSWISAASFQETAKVLTDAATAGKIDRLKGLKENVIVGRLIPAGTGFKKM